jgi:hypothetical protein
MTAIRRLIWRPLSGRRGSPATIADPAVGAIRVPSIRTVVVFPAPLGPRKPNTSPAETLNETSSTATRSPKRFVRCSTTSAGSPESGGSRRRIGAGSGGSRTPDTCLSSGGGAGGSSALAGEADSARPPPVRSATTA